MTDMIEQPDYHLFCLHFLNRQAATPSNLAELLREVQATYQRMSPFMNQICELAAADPEISSQVGLLHLCPHKIHHAC